MEIRNIPEDLFFEVFNADLPRHGAGDDESTRRAFSYLVDLPRDACVLDVGCGTGEQTLVLAGLIGGRIYALDNYQPFLEKLERRIVAAGYGGRVFTVNESMLEMEFEEGSFDVVWSEGAAFIYGFEKALEDWPYFLKSKGYMVLSELCWFKENMPREIYDYLVGIYPPLKSIQGNMALIESKNLDLIAHFNVPEKSWWSNYYNPLQENIVKAQRKYRDDPEALKKLQEFSKEMEMYRKYSKYYGYTFYIMRKKS